MTLIVAELSGNHNGSLERMLALIRAAKSAGADAVKFQTYTADTLTMKSNHPCFVIEGGPWAGRTYYNLYQDAATPWEWYKPMISECKRVHIKWFSTPFDRTAVDFLESLRCPIYKVSSFDVTDHQLLDYIASKNKPVIMSTGKCTNAEIVSAIKSFAYVPKLTLLHCISEYPADIKTMYMQKMNMLRNMFNGDIGLSDHSLSNLPSVVATSLGANVIEKHLCLSRKDGGPDSKFSTEPYEFARLVADIRDVESMFSYKLKDEINVIYRKSLFATKDILYGKRLTRSNTKLCRPCVGIPADKAHAAIGKKVKVQVLRVGNPILWGDLA